MGRSNFLVDAFKSLGQNINKAKGSQDDEMVVGVDSDKLPELSLKMDDKKLVDLATKWERKWLDSEVYASWKAKGEINEKYWNGEQHDKPAVDKRRSLVDNVIFESLETYLPQVTRRNPEPMVQLAQGEEESKEKLEFAQDVQKALAETADEIRLRLKLKRVARYWALYLLGVAKPAWDIDNDMPTLRVIRGQKLILDPDAPIDEDGYHGEFIGEHREMSAGSMISIMDAVGGEKDALARLKEAVGDDLGTKVKFVEWWNDEYLFWKMNSTILLKRKNPHWNYGTDVEAPADEMTGETPLNEDGTPMTEEKKGVNHFSIPKKPYIFFSVFNLGKSPVDDTSLIGQNLANQDLINKRVRQIDKNADSMNGGMVVSGERSGLSQAQAKGVSSAIRNGGTIFIPSGSPSDAVVRMSAPSLPGDIYNQLADTRNRVQDIFGTRGSSAAGISTEKTVRGKFMNKALDTDRIGGGVSEYLEQFSDEVYNWFIQLSYVYSEDLAGKEFPKLIVGVKEGSLLPKDNATMAQQAVELAGSGKMSLIDLYKKLDYPNPEELAANLWLEANAPEVVFASDPRVQQVLEQRQKAAQEQAGQQETPPSRSISFKDLPPEGKQQLAKQAGIELDPMAIVANEEREISNNKPAPVIPAAKKENI